MRQDAPRDPGDVMTALDQPTEVWGGGLAEHHVLVIAHRQHAQMDGDGVVGTQGITIVEIEVVGQGGQDRGELGRPTRELRLEVLALISDVPRKSREDPRPGLAGQQGGLGPKARGLE